MLATQTRGTLLSRLNFLIFVFFLFSFLFFLFGFVLIFCISPAPQADVPGGPKEESPSVAGQGHASREPMARHPCRRQERRRWRQTQLLPLLPQGTHSRCFSFFSFLFVFLFSFCFSICLFLWSRHSLALQGPRITKCWRTTTSSPYSSSPSSRMLWLICTRYSIYLYYIFV